MDDIVEIENVENHDPKHVIQGEWFRKIIDKPQHKEDKDNLRDKTINIYEALKFDGDTGLILGQVQSGKTLSFLALSGLARDNQVPLVIILSGSSKILSAQTKDRVEKDFDLENNQINWRVASSQEEFPQPETLFDNLEHWEDPEARPERKKANILICMKEWTNITKLIKLLKEDPRLSEKLKTTKALIIDDEADHYSLNTKKGNDVDEASTTYRKIIELKNCLPKSSFLGYTATPQAPFLISLLDRLSPEFAEVINPGKDYVGIEDLFQSESDYIKYIDSEEEITEEEMQNGDIPDDLKLAIASFLVGAGQAVYEDVREPRSMLIHPSRLQLDHDKYKKWVDNLISYWKDLLSKGQGAEYEEMINLLGEAYDDLSSTYVNFAQFEEIEKYIKTEVMRSIPVEVINSGPKATNQNINWKTSLFFIVISGQSMDRGTTVEGLTVTYLSRSLSKTNDTQMQRARFLGYKRDYLGLIRVFCDPDTYKFYKNYIITQKDFTELVTDFSNSGKDFKHAKREWRLSKNTQSCRRNVVKLAGAMVVTKKREGGNWSLPRHPLQNDWRSNNQVIKDFLANYQLTESKDAGKSDVTMHSEIELPFDEVYKNLFVNLSYSNYQDSQLFTPMLYYLHSIYAHWSDYESLLGYVDEMKCRIIDINARSKTPRKRTINSEGKLKGFGQGAAPDRRSASETRPYASEYSGDLNIYDPKLVTLQIHTLDIQNEQKVLQQPGVKIPAIRLPDLLWNNYDLQTQKKDGGAEDINIDEVNEI